VSKSLSTEVNNSCEAVKLEVFNHRLASRFILTVCQPVLTIDVLSNVVCISWSFPFNDIFLVFSISEKLPETTPLI